MFYAHKVLDNTAQERLRAGLLPLKKEGQTRILSSAMAEFKTLPESKRVRHIAQARARSRSAPAVCGPRLDARCKDHSTGLFSQGSYEFPLSFSAVETTMRGFLGVAPYSPLPGLSLGLAKLRDAFTKTLFVPDDGAIPSADKFSYRRTCWQQYYGLCEHCDGANLPVYGRVGSSLHDAVVEGQWFMLRSFAEDSDVEGGLEILDTGYFFTAFKRGRDPKVSVVCSAVRFADTLGSLEHR